MSLLKEQEVLKIVRQSDEGISVKELAKKFGKHTATIYDILSGKIWNNVTHIKPKIEHKNRLYGSMTDSARLVYKNLLEYKKKNREFMFKEYKFLEYRADLNFTKEGEEFLIFKAKVGKYLKYVGYGSEDTVIKCSWNTLKKYL